MIMSNDNKYWDGIVTERVTLCEDGKYRWRYDVNLFKDLRFFWLVWKILFAAFMIIFLFVFISDAINWGLTQERIIYNLKFLAYFLVGMTGVSSLGYSVYATVMGGKYCVVFEMDEIGINHRQTDAQAKKAKKLGAITALGGAATGSLSTTGVGINATRTEMYSEFARVKKVKPYPRKNTIKVNETLNHNQVYVQKADFDFVQNYIISHCANLK